MTRCPGAPCDGFPLPPNGKIDQKALPVPGPASRPSSRPARNPREKILCGLFADVLGVDEVGIDDGFFELGGDSILSIQLVSRARRAGAVFSVREVFEHQSVAGLVQVADWSGRERGAGVIDEPVGVFAGLPIVSWPAERGGDWRGFNQSQVVRTPAGLSEAALCAALREWLRERLPSYMVPAAIVPLDAIPLTGNGKLNVAALPAPVASPHRTAPAVPPRDALERTVVQVWQELLGVPDAGIDDDFFDSGGDSFKAVTLARNVGHGRLSVVDVFTYPTPRQLAGRLRAAGQDAADGRWLHRLVADDGQRIRRVVIGISYGGGSATAYQALAAHLPPGTALWSAALPGHDPVRPEEPLVGWAQARDHLGEEIVRIQSAVHGVPVTLYGHCVGTGLTLAVARQLEDRGVPLASVCLGAALPLSQAREVGDDDELYASLSGLGGFEGALDQEDIRRVLAVVRHDMAQGAELLREASAGWEPLRTPARVIIGDADAATEGHERGYRAWERFAREVSLEVIPGGGHYFVKDRAEEVARIIG